MPPSALPDGSRSRFPCSLLKKCATGSASAERRPIPRHSQSQWHTQTANTVLFQPLLAMRVVQVVFKALVVARQPIAIADSGRYSPLLFIRRESLDENVIPGGNWQMRRARANHQVVRLLAVPCRREGARADQFFELGNAFHRGTGILPVFSGHGQDARTTQIERLIGPGEGASSLAWHTENVVESELAK
jgi:hypothetical protein